MKFVDEIPTSTKKAPGSLGPVLAELRARPGQWAEITRYAPIQRPSAASRGGQIARRYPDIEYAVRAQADEVVLYLRAVAA